MEVQRGFWIENMTVIRWAWLVSIFLFFFFLLFFVTLHFSYERRFNLDQQCSVQKAFIFFLAVLARCTLNLHCITFACSLPAEYLVSISTQIQQISLNFHGVNTSKIC